MSIQTANQVNSGEAAIEPVAVATATTPLALPSTVTSIQEALRAAGPNGTAKFSATTQLTRGYETAISIRNFKLVVDEPPSLGGTDLGPNPAELLLAALGTCQEIVYSTYAPLLNVQIDHLDIKVTGTLDPRGFFGVADVPAGFDHVEYEVNLVSPSPAERVRKLVDTVNAHCPVLDTLQRPLPVQTRVEHNGEVLTG
jgi:putative redox protein